MIDVAALIIGLAARHGHTDTDRLRAVAADVERAAHVHPTFCSWQIEDPEASIRRIVCTGCGWSAVEATETALVAIGEHESGWSPNVQDCSYSVDRQYGLWQLHGPVAMDGHSRAEICSNDALSAELAAKVLAAYRHAGGVDVMMRGYASGNEATVSRAAREIAGLVFTLAWKPRLAFDWNNGCLEAYYR